MTPFYSTAMESMMEKSMEKSSSVDDVPALPQTSKTSLEAKPTKELLWGNGANEDFLLPCKQVNSDTELESVSSITSSLSGLLDEAATLCIIVKTSSTLNPKAAPWFPATSLFSKSGSKTMGKPRVGLCSLVGEPSTLIWSSTPWKGQWAPKVFSVCSQPPSESIPYICLTAAAAEVAGAAAGKAEEEAIVASVPVGRKKDQLNKGQRMAEKRPDLQASLAENAARALTNSGQARELRREHEALVKCCRYLRGDLYEQAKKDVVLLSSETDLLILASAANELRARLGTSKAKELPNLVSITRSPPSSVFSPSPAADPSLLELFGLWWF